jgi:hypothetical protein
MTENTHDWEHDPEETAAALIATLPDDFGALRFAELDALKEARGRILVAGLAVLDAEKGLLDRVTAERHPSPAQTLGEVMTEAEQAELLGLNRRLLGFERATAALDAWYERSGARAFGWPGPVGPVEPLVIEEPDGELSLLVEKGG